MVTRSHLQEAGLPAIGVVQTSCTPVQEFESALPFAKVGSGVNSRLLYSAVFGYNIGTSHFSMSFSVGYLIIRWSVPWVAFLHVSISAFETEPSLNAVMMHPILFKPFHSFFRSFSSILTPFSASRKDSFFGLVAL